MAALGTIEEQRALMSWGRPGHNNVPLGSTNPVTGDHERLQLLYLSQGVVPATHGVMGTTGPNLHGSGWVPPGQLHGNF